MRRSGGRCLTLAAVALLAAGCGGGNGNDGGRVTTTTTTATAPFDRAFIDAMVPHHRAAISMSKEALAAGLAAPDLVAVARAIIATQQGEIDRMKTWRRAWFGSAEIDPNGASALGMSADEMGMQHDAGTLAGSGDVDAAFASMMIDHHDGAIAMAKLARTQARHAEVRRLADEIVRAQEREIAIMRDHAGMHH